MTVPVADARARAESLMTSTCTVFTDGEPVTDPDTGEVTVGEDVVYAGPCRVRPAGREAHPQMIGGAEAFAFDYLVSIPFAVAAVAEGQRLRVTASPDPALVGVVVEIQKVDRGDSITARRLACSEVA